MIWSILHWPLCFLLSGTDRLEEWPIFHTPRSSSFLFLLSCSMILPYALCPHAETAVVLYGKVWTSLNISWEPYKNLEWVHLPSGPRVKERAELRNILVQVKRGSNLGKETGTTTTGRTSYEGNHERTDDSSIVLAKLMATKKNTFREGKQKSAEHRILKDVSWSICMTRLRLSGTSNHRKLQDMYVLQKWEAKGE